MIVMVQDPNQWKSDMVQSQQQCQAIFDENESAILQPQVLRQNELSTLDLSDYSLIQLVEGMIGLQVDGHRLFAMEAGDCWLANAGQALHWFQEGAAKVRFLKWNSIQANEICSLAVRFQDAVIGLLQHNNLSKIDNNFLQELQYFQEGDIILEEGAKADSVLTLVQGSASVFIDGVKVGIVKESEILGLQALLLKMHRTATVVADCPCTAIKVSYDNFKSLIESRPDLAVSAMETMAEQINRLNRIAVKQQRKE